MKILIVDDEASIRELLHFNLARAGYEVLEAADGQAALQQAIEALRAGAALCGAFGGLLQHAFAVQITIQPGRAHRGVIGANLIADNAR